MKKGRQSGGEEALQAEAAARAKALTGPWPARKSKKAVSVGKLVIAVWHLADKTHYACQS